MSEVNRLEWDAYIRDSELLASVNRIERRVGGMVDNVAKKGKDMENVFANMAKAATAFFTLSTAENFVQQLISVRSEFQQLDIAFTTMLGSKEKADQLTKDLIEFAGTTPFGMKDTANAAKQLLAYGSAAKDVKGELRMLGDIASGTSQPIGDLVYLYGTLRTQGQAYLMDIRQFAGRGLPIYRELATVLGVAESQVNGLVSAGRVGFEQVQQALQNMTAAGSMFGGLMEAQSKTIQGELERLGDAYDQMLNKIGADNEGMISKSIQGLSSLVENYETVLNIIGGLITVYGAYRAALIATAALQQISAARTVGMTAAEMIHIGAITAKTAAMKALNAIMLASPVILMTAGITALSAAFYALTQVADATSAAHEKLSEAQEAGLKKSDQERRTIAQLTDIIKSNSNSLEERKVAYDKLQAQTKGVLSSFSMEEIAIGKAGDALDQYVLKIGRAASARKAFDEFNALAEKMDELERKGNKAVSFWTKLGRTLKNSLGPISSDLTWSEWKNDSDPNFIANQEKKVIRAQMKELEKEFGVEFKSYITGVEQTSKEATPSDLFAKSLKDPINNFNSLLKSISNKSDVDSLKKALTEKLEALAPGDSQIAGLKAKLQKVSKLEEQYSLTKANSPAKVENQKFQTAERYLTMLEQIDSAEKQALNNQLSRDDQEIANVRDKYNSLRNEIRKFNADPKNSIQIDGKRVDGLESSEIESVKQKQLNDKKLLQYDEDYRNYLRYEQLKVEAGQKYADDQLGTFKDYLSKLQNEINALQGKKFTEGLSSVDESYLKELENKLKASNDSRIENQQNAFLQMLQLSESFYLKEKSTREKYQKAYETLENSKTSISEIEYNERKNALSTAMAEEISAIRIANIQKEQDWEKTFNYLQFMSKKASMSALNDIQKRLDAELKAGEITRKDYDRYTSEVNQAKNNVNLQKSWIASKDALNAYRDAVKQYGKDSAEAKKAQSEMFTALASDLQKAQAVLGDVGNLLDSLGAGDGLQETIGKIGNLVGGMSSLATGIASGNPIDIISGSIKTLTSVIGLFNNKDKKIQKQIDAYQDRLDSLGKSFSKLQDQINNSVGDSYYSDSNKAIQNLKAQQAALYQMANAEEQKKKPDSNKVKDYRNQAEAINQEILEIQRSINENLLQTTFKDLSNELANALLSAFEAGEDGIESMNKTYDKFIKNALVNSLKLKMIEPIISEMTSKIADYMSSNGNSLIGYDFTTWKDKLGQVSQEFTNALDQAYAGLGLTKDGDSSSSSLKAEEGITRMSESTGTEIVGTFRAGYDIWKQQLIALKDVQSQGANYLTIANDQLTKLNSIDINTANTVAELKTAVSVLNQINKNIGGRHAG